MPYLGNNLATQFQAFATQTITGDGSTGYTLDRAVANGKELLVYINNVKQEEGSGKSYTASGTTITFSAAVASGDSCYLVYMGSAQQTVTAPAGSIVSSQLATAFPSASLDMNGTELILDADGDTSITSDTDDQIDFKVGGTDRMHLVAEKLGIGTSSPGRLVTIFNNDQPVFQITNNTSGSASGNGLIQYMANGSTNAVFDNQGSGSGGVFQFMQAGTEAMNIDANGHITKPLQPAFLAHASGSQNDMTAGSTATVVLSTEVYDQNNDFASNTFTAPVDGKYFLVFTALFTDVQTEFTEIEIRINTSNRIYRLFIIPSIQLSADGSIGDSFSVVADMDASDTAIIQVTPVGGSDEMNIHSYTFFSGCLLS